MFRDMIQEMLGIPGMNFGLAKTRINEAFQYIQNRNVWSFQLKDGGWLTPSLLGGMNPSFQSPGTITVVPFTTTITADPIATAAWVKAAPYPPLLTQQQIRVPYYSLYNIIALGNNGTVAYLTIDTPGSGQMPGTYTVNAVPVGGAPGSGAQAQIVVNADGTVTQTPVIISAGQGYAQAPIFTLAAGGTPATFTSTLIATVTIDRPWTEPPQTDGTYMIYQAYYPAPPGFKRWFSIRDTTNNNAMDWWSKTQVNLAEDDPQRTIFDQPYYVVPWGIDQRPGSATTGQMLFELWPHPDSQLPYTFDCQCNWTPLSLPTDTLPYPLTEEIVKERAYQMLALWKESQKGDDQERGSGANWQFLAAAHKSVFDELLKSLRIMDRSLIELYYTRANRIPPFLGEPFATVNGQLNVGGL
ncbi:MAG TPA: hypothetical protein VFW94_24395 [Candidatus Acidoferrales bacterium]|nr:hypothetical protein [Candidatus Acidoferrales bacterium]